jgi:hypothetical protein
MIKKSRAANNIGFVRYAELLFWLDSRFRGNDGFFVLLYQSEESLSLAIIAPLNITHH